MNSKALKALQSKSLKSLYASKFEKDACGVALSKWIKEFLHIYQWFTYLFFKK